MLGLNLNWASIYLKWKWFLQFPRIYVKRASIPGSRQTKVIIRVIWHLIEYIVVNGGLLHLSNIGFTNENDNNNL